MLASLGGWLNEEIERGADPVLVHPSDHRDKPDTVKTPRRVPSVP